MTEYNCIVIFDTQMKNVLFCRRKKDPYKGLYNFVGGKREDGESSDDSAYRELLEETGITKEKMKLSFFMDIEYTFLDYKLMIYYGLIDKNEPIVDEINPLIWLPIDQRYENVELFAGDQNIGHIIRMAKKCISINDG